ncbi:MAG: hypothetical protein LC772_10770, partial [Chloroflexi bacterium]|nr:hypothetical protein [Chloroflexota bacterium]
MDSPDQELQIWELAFGLLFQVDVGKSSLSDAIAASEEMEESPVEVRDAAALMAARTVGQGRLIDRLIRASARNYTVPRIPSVERNILRLAVGCLLQPDEPPNLTTERAGRLALQYADAEAARFVTGVLGGVLAARAAQAQAEADGAVAAAASAARPGDPEKAVSGKASPDADLSSPSEDAEQTDIERDGSLEPLDFTFSKRANEPIDGAISGLI